MTRCIFVALACLGLLGGCERTFRDMYDQPRYRPLARSTLWPDGRSARPPVEGTVARSAGTFAGTSSGRLGTIAMPPDVPAVDAIRPDLRQGIDEPASADPVAFPVPGHSPARGGPHRAARAHRRAG